MADNYSGTDDDLSQFPSAASPLAARGIDAYEVRSNPQMLQQLTPWAQNDDWAAQQSQPAAPSASATTAGATGGAAAPATTDYATEGLSEQQKDWQKHDALADLMPTSSPQIEQLQQQRQRIAAPAPLFDPQTGKMLDSTTETNPDGTTTTINPKASIGSKIWRGVRGGLTGLAIGGIPGALVGGLAPQKITGAGTGYDDPSKAYQQGEQRREQALAANTDQTKTAFDTFKAAQDARTAQAKLYQNGGDMADKQTTSATGVQNAATSAQTEKDTAANNAARTPQATAAVADAEQQKRMEQVANPRLPFHRMPSWQQWAYIADGKINSERPPQLPAEVQLFDEAKAAWKRDPANAGKIPTVADVQQWAAAAKGSDGTGTGKTSLTPNQWQSLVKQHDQEYETAQRDKESEIKAANGVPEAIAAINSKYDARAQDLQNTWNQRFAEADPEGKFARGGGASAATPAAAAPTKPAPAGALGHIRGSDGKLYWSSNGKTGDLGLAQ